MSDERWQWIEYESDLWYCNSCGETWDRGSEPITFEWLCDCGWLMKPGVMTFQEKVPIPDPLEVLVDSGENL